MTVRGHNRAALLAGLLATIPASASWAHTLEAPASVCATTENGQFVFDVVFTASEPVVLAAFYTTGDNVNESVGDCFCAPGCEVDADETLTFEVLDWLIDPSQPGTLHFTLEFCGADQLETTTAIQPLSECPTLSGWGAATLTLLLLASALTLIRRRQSAAA